MSFDMETSVLVSWTKEVSRSVRIEVTSFSTVWTTGGSVWTIVVGSILVTTAVCWGVLVLNK